jgi:hypothetical protein
LNSKKDHRRPGKIPMPRGDLAGAPRRERSKKPLQLHLQLATVAAVRSILRQGIALLNDHGRRLGRHHTPEQRPARSVSTGPPNLSSTASLPTPGKTPSGRGEDRKDLILLQLRRPRHSSAGKKRKLSTRQRRAGLPSPSAANWRREVEENAGLPGGDTTNSPLASLFASTVAGEKEKRRETSQFPSLRWVRSCAREHWHLGST